MGVHGLAHAAYCLFRADGRILGSGMWKDDVQIGVQPVLPLGSGMQ